MSVIKQFIIIFFYGNLQAVVHWMCVFIILCISPLWQSKSFVFYGAIENHHTGHHMKRQCTFNENRSKFIFLGLIGRLGVLPAKFKNVWPNFMIHSGGVCRWAVNTWNSGSGGPGFKTCPWHYCFLTQGTLLHFASLHPGV